MYPICYDINMAGEMCKEGKEAGILNPESRKGIDFCINKCPYPDGCIVLEQPAGRQSYKQKRLEAVRKLGSPSALDVSKMFGVSLRTAQKYLAECKDADLDK